MKMEELMRLTFNILDSVDLLSMLGEKEEEIHDFMDRLNRTLEPEVEKYPELEGCLFNGVNDVEFIDYLRQRYPGEFYDREVSIYYVGKIKKK